jgi:hypothetical protein
LTIGKGVFGASYCAGESPALLLIKVRECRSKLVWVVLWLLSFAEELNRDVCCNLKPVTKFEKEFIMMNS